MRVFVLGAGASRPARFPLANELMRELREHLASEQRSESEAHAYFWDQMLERGIFREHDDAELNFTRLQLYVRSVYSSRDAGKAMDPMGAVNLFLGLPQLIDRYFQSLQRKLVRDAPERLEYLRAFLRRHVRKGDVIVTFNYDCLAEVALQKDGRWSLRRGYGPDLAPVYPELESEPDRTECKVIKLHGSVGWLGCVDPKAIHIRDVRSPRLEFDELLVARPLLGLLGYGDLEARDPERKRAARDSVVLPTYLKSIDGYPLPVIWRAASESFRAADRVVVVGYSFPKADGAARALFLSGIPSGGRIDLYWFGRESQDIELLRHFFAQAGVSLHDWVARIEDLADSNDLPLG